MRKTRVEISIRGAFPPSYRPLLAQAAKTAIKTIPTSVWKQHRSNCLSAELSISIVGKVAMTRLNKRFRGKNRPTDVLSFPSAAVPGSDFVGDIIVCWDVARRQTEAFQTTPREEVQRLVVHGVLHLFGYDHEKSAAQAKRMFRLQDKVLAGLRTQRAR